MGILALLHGGARTWQALNRLAHPGYHMAVLGLGRHVNKHTQATGIHTVALGPIKCTNVCAQAAVLALGHSIVMNRCTQVDNWH